MKQEVNDLMVLAIQAQIVHWKTDNYATHIATEELYDGLREYTDNLVEALKADRIDSGIIPDNINVSSKISKEELLINLEYHLVHFEELSHLEFGIQNIVDDICSLMRTQIYKLTYLS